VPFVARELDLLKSGEEDAAALGVDVARVKRLSLVASALAASAAVAVAGQIGFVGLGGAAPRSPDERTQLSLAPVARRSRGRRVPARRGSHPTLLLGEGALQPGVMMSLVGGPFFLFLLVRQRREIATW
jgi:iron complex transport system permease protein